MVMNMEFYTVDMSYVKALYDTDTEVFYDIDYEDKPYVGVIVVNSGYNYFIPLTSAKFKHRRWKNVSRDNYVVYEIVKGNRAIPRNWVYTVNPQTNDIKHILAVLDIKKMIPVPDKLCSKIQFSAIADKDYKSLLQKEYYFLKPLYQSIQAKAIKIYDHQVKSGEIKEFYCNFKLLEAVCDTYK